MKLDLKVFSVSGTWEPNDVERRAAWELYVELITRIGVVPLRDGLLREALTSLYSTVKAVREVLRRYGPEVAEPKRDGQYSLGFLTVAMVNTTLRPLLSYWHPMMEDWETLRPLELSRLEHERAWSRHDELRAAIGDAGAVLAQYAHLLALACGVPDLKDAIPTD